MLLFKKLILVLLSSIKPGKDIVLLTIIELPSELLKPFKLTSIILLERSKPLEYTFLILLIIFVLSIWEIKDNI